jgi:hypothetical protein
MKQDELFGLFKKNNLTPNQYERLLDFSKNDNWQNMFIVSDNQVLFDEEFLVETKDGKCLMTKKGEDLIKKVEKLFRKETAGSKKVDAEFTANVIQYREMFPAIKLPTGLYARVAVKNLEPAFVWFFDNFDYTWEIVFKATKLYLNQKEMERWKFCRNSQYFIRKDDGSRNTASDLANFCENILNGADENEKNFFETKVV